VFGLVGFASFFDISTCEPETVSFGVLRCTVPWKLKLFCQEPLQCENYHLDGKYNEEVLDSTARFVDPVKLIIYACVNREQANDKIDDAVDARHE